MMGKVVRALMITGGSIWFKLNPLGRSESGDRIGVVVEVEPRGEISVDDCVRR